MTNINKAYIPKTEENQNDWLLIDAAGKTVGRLATDIANKLRGKDKPTFMPHVKTGPTIVVINAEKVFFSGNKMETKTYHKHTGYVGNDQTIYARVLKKENPERILELAVKGMLPKNKLCKQLEKRLKIYKGNVHPHSAQI